MFQYMFSISEVCTKYRNSNNYLASDVSSDRFGGIYRSPSLFIFDVVGASSLPSKRRPRPAS